MTHLATRGIARRSRSGGIREKRGSTLCDRGPPRGRIETLRSRSDGQNEREIVGPRSGIMPHLASVVVDVHLIFLRSNGPRFSSGTPL